MKNLANVVGDASTSISIDGVPVFNLNDSRPYPIASVTKIVTTLVSLTIIQDLEGIEPVKVGDVVSGSQHYLSVGDQATIETYLQFALKSSSNTSANIVARAAGTGVFSRKISDERAITAFLKRANQYVRQLGMNNTKIVDASGLGHGNVSSTADLLRLLAAADENAMIGRYASLKPSLVAVATDLGTRDVLANHTADVIFDNSIVWAKTGTLLGVNAGICISAVHNGKQIYIAVGNCQRPNQRFRIAKRALDEAKALAK